MRPLGTVRSAAPARRPARRWWLLYLLTAAVITVGAPMLPAGPVQLGLEALGSASVIGAILFGIRLHRPHRRTAWYVLLAAVFSAVVVGAAGPALLAAGVTAQFPLVEMMYFATFPLFAVALAMLPVQGRYGSPLAGMTEAGIIASVTVVLWWALLVDPLVLDQGRFPEQAHVVIYPVLDLTLLVMAVRMALIAGSRSMSYVLIAGSTLALLTADTMFFFAVLDAPGQPPPMGSIIFWLLTNALLGTAALHPSMARQAPPSPTRRRAHGIVGLRLWVFAPAVAPAVVGGSLLTQPGHDLDAWDVIVPLGATTLTAALVAVRLLQLNRVARRHATDLDARTAALETARQTEAQLLQEMRHRALHDPLTGLPNRALLHERLNEALHRRATGALLVVDLDGFKEVNDRFGHAMGDDLLVAVGKRIASLIGPTDLLARPGGDEFAVLMENVRSEITLRQADVLVAAMRRPVTVRGHELYATVSIGVRALDASGRTVDMLRDADLALHAAKAAGRDRTVAYEEALREERLAKSRMVERLRAAIEREELVVFYQPMVRLSDRRYQSVEALVRWQPPGASMVGPDAFIPAAEDSGLIVGMGEWVLRRACRDTVPWHERYGTTVSVNVSPRQLREPGFGDVVRRALHDTGLPAQALILEITEGVLVDSGAATEQAIAHLAALRLDGIRVAVDDFGTGYSSLAYLRDLPIDLIKIDKAFLPTDEADAESRAMIVKAIVDLATGLGLGTVAEGVETPWQVTLLRRLGCERAQGYFFARPAPAAEVTTLLAGAARSRVGARGGASKA